MNTTLPIVILAIFSSSGCDDTVTSQTPAHQTAPITTTGIEPSKESTAVQVAQQDSKWEETQKKSAQAWDATRDASSSAWDATKESSTEAWDTTKEKSSETWQATKEASGELWDKTKSTSGDAWDATKEKSNTAWEATKSGSASVADKVDETLSGDSTK